MQHSLWLGLYARLALAGERPVRHSLGGGGSLKWVVRVTEIGALRKPSEQRPRGGVLGLLRGPPFPRLANAFGVAPFA